MIYQIVFCHATAELWPAEVIIPEISTLLALLALLAVTGAFAGIIAGMLGVGGGIILVPALYYLFSTMGFESAHLMQICLATSLATIVFTSLRSVLAHHRKGAVDWQILRTWAPGAALGAAIATGFATGLRGEVLMLIFGVLGLIVGLYLAFGRREWRLGDTLPTGPTRGIWSVVLGFFSVLMGIGGGSFGVPLMSLYGQPIHRAVATASGFGVAIALPSTVGFLLGGQGLLLKPPATIGYVNVPAFGVIVIATLLTTPLGVQLAHAMNPRPLRLAFAIFIIFMAGNMLRKAFAG